MGGRSTSARGHEQLALRGSSRCNQKAMGGWIGSPQNRLILLSGINHLLIYNKMNNSAQDEKSGLFGQVCEALQGYSHSPRARSSVRNGETLPGDPPQPHLHMAAP